MGIDVFPHLMFTICSDNRITNIIENGASTTNSYLRWTSIASSSIRRFNINPTSTYFKPTTKQIKKQIRLNSLIFRSIILINLTREYYLVHCWFLPNGCIQLLPKRETNYYVPTNNLPEKDQFRIQPIVLHDRYLGFVDCIHQILHFRSWTKSWHLRSLPMGRW